MTYFSKFTKMKNLKILFFSLICIGLQAQESPKEEDFYRIITPPIPEGVILEVGGLCTLPNGSLAMATRRGEIWIMDNPTSRNPHFRLFASGLHEVLGLAHKNGALYCVQRGELTKLMDNNEDGIADTYETVHAWPVSGHYHEYSFGPKIAPDGSFFVSGNVAFGNEEWWRGEARVPTRGTVFKVFPDGHREEWAAGMRSPAGLGVIDGELFYADNQGDWMGSGGIWHLKKGVFTGHPASLAWVDENSPVTLTEDQFYAERDNRKVRNATGAYIKPENVQGENADMLWELKEKYPSVQTPVVWLPHGILGISNSELIKDETKGAFGPFVNQVFIGDQGQSKIMRVFMEKINGEYQGAAWDFRSGFQSGVMRMDWAKDGSLFVGETNRGWGSAGDANQGLQRLVWNGQMPFEMLTVKAMPDGFEVEFTLPVDRKSAEDLASYAASSFNYKHHPVYGSPPINRKDLNIKGVNLSADGKRLRIVIDGLRKYYIHELNLDGIRAAGKYYSLIHPTVYYTLNNIPEGEKMSSDDLKTNTSAKVKAESSTRTAKLLDTPDRKNKATIAVNMKAPTFDQVKPLLQRHTCLACHAEGKKVIGPSFTDISKRKYSDDEILKLVYTPKPKNWPDYATPMAAMPHVPEEDVLKIASYINGLR
ncbi:MAG: cytochrome c551/c552 [Psychromonas sp.]|jgi:cytochrome c551/c552